MKMYVGVLALLCSMVSAGSAAAQLTTPQAGTKSQVLILDTTVTGGLSSAEAVAVTSAPGGLTPVTMTGAAWSAMTAAQFSSYRALVIGDRTCPSMSPPLATAPFVTTAMTWGPAVTGPAILIGTDPTFHRSYRPGAQQLITRGIVFATSDPVNLGAYITLSCHYHTSALGTAVPALSGLGGAFTVMGAALVANLEDSHIVATHVALASLTDADLASWGNSVHNGFHSWPTTWMPLAITRDPTGPFTAKDGSKGYPYILARAEGLVAGNIALGPVSAENPVGSSHTVTATILVGGSPQAGVVVTFTIVSGPHAGLTSTATTNSAGQATWTYPGTMAGTDVIKATAIVRDVRQESNTVRKTWVAPPVDPCCATLDVQPFPDPPTNNDVRTFTITNPVKNRAICYVEIKWVPSVPAFYTGGGPGTASYGGIIVDGQVEGPTAGAWFAAPYNRIPKTGTFASSPYPFTVPAPAGAKDEIAFNLGVDYVWANDNGWTGTVKITVHYCDKTICELEYGPWTPRPPKVDDAATGAGGFDPKIRQRPEDPQTWTFELDSRNSPNAPKWIGFSVGRGHGLMVNSGMVRGGGRLERVGAVAAQLAPHGLRPNSALFVLPEGARTSQFDVRATGEGRNPVVRWTTYGEDGSILQTGTIPSRQGTGQAEPARPEQPRRN